MSTSRSMLALQIGNIAAFIITLTINGLVANTTLIGGRTTAQVSDTYFTLITPAGYVFAIWGIIYVLLGIFVVYQALPRNRNSAFLKQVSALFILSSTLNVLWLFLWQYDYIGFSLIVMFALLTSLAAIYLRLKIGKSNAPLKQKTFVHLPFSVYIGWITVASAANVAATLSWAGWITWTATDAVWAILAIAVALGVTVVVLASRRDIAYALVILWALIGIAVNQAPVPDVANAAWIGAALATVALVATAVITKLKQ